MTARKAEVAAENGSGSMRGRALRYVAALLPTLVAGVLLTLGVVLSTRARGFEVFGATNSLLTALNFFVFAVVATIIILKGSFRVGGLFAVAALAWGAVSFADAVVQYTRIYDVGHVPGEELLVWSSSIWEFIGIGAAPTVLLFVFPSGRFETRGTALLALFTVLAVAIGVTGSAFAPGALEDWPTITNPKGVGGGVGEVFVIMKDLGWALLGIALATAAWSFKRRFERAPFVERQQMKWMVLAGMAVVLFLLFWAVSEGLFDDATAEKLQGLALVPIPLAAAIAIARYGLYDVDVIINRTAIYGLLSAVLGSTYFVLVVTFQRLTDSFTQDSDLVIAASTLVVAALFGPARTRVQAFIDRRFYRSRYDASETLEAFSTRLRDEVDLVTLSDDLLRVVGKTMQPRHASLWLRSREETG